MVGAGAVLGACSLALSYSGIDDGVRDAASQSGDGSSPLGSDAAGLDGTAPLDATADTTAPPTDGQPAPPGDAGADADANGNADAADSSSTVVSDGACPTLPGPVLVPAGAFCIDSTEVTVGQYAAFLTAKAGSTSGQPALCSSWNTTLTPGDWATTGAGAQDLPVPYTNWCEAFTYCAWAGKRLCGAPDGGSADPRAWYDPTKSEWAAACTHGGDGNDVYPYGLAFSATTCNGDGYGAGKTLPSVSTCVGGYPGLFDMSGNVYEWEDSCQNQDGGPLAGENDFCFTRGGAFDADAATLQCDDGTAYTRYSQAADLGFRCCWP